MTVAAAEIIFTRMMLMFFALAAMPMEEGENMHIDVITPQGVQATMHLERSKNEYTLYSPVADPADDKRTELGKIEWNGENTSLKHIRKDDQKISSHDLSPLLKDIDLEDLPDLHEHGFKSESGEWMLLQRRDSNLYLTANDQTLVAHIKTENTENEDQ